VVFPQPNFPTISPSNSWAEVGDYFWLNFHAKKGLLLPFDERDKNVVCKMQETNR